MKEPRGIRTFVLAVLCLTSVSAAQQAQYTWAIEINGRLCGYSDASVSMARDDGREYRLIEQTMVFSAVVLGLNVDRRVEPTYHVDPATGQYDYCARHVTGADMDLRSEVVVEGHTAVYSPLLSDESRQVTLGRRDLHEHRRGHRLSARGINRGHKLFIYAWHTFGTWSWV